MSEALRPYAAYRDSGVPWLGDVPAHWEIVPNRALFAEIIEKGHSDEQMLSVTIGRGVIQQSDLLENSSKKDSSNENKSNYKLVMPGDIAYNKMRAWQGAIGVSEYRGIVSPAYVIVRPRRKHDSRYFHYLYRTLAFAKEAERWSYGITSDQWSLRPEYFKQIYSCLPPPSEQGAIVRYLDYVDARIRRYVRAKRRLIELLTEQKQALIHQAVTGRVDVRTGEPYAAYKPSGVEWLGDVPAHWTLKRFKFLTSITSGQVDPRIVPYRDMILVAPNHIRSGTGQIYHTETAAAQGADSGKYEVREGQVVYSKIRPNLRKAAIAPFECLCSADMYPIAIDENQLRTGHFLLLLLSEPFTKYVVDCSMRVAMPKVNRESLREALLWYPSLEEQDAILRYLTFGTEHLDSASESLRREIDLIREYRTRLIADVVTGKLDVREAAARLPAAAEEQEAIEDAELDDEASVPEGSVAEDFETIDDEVLAEDG